MKPVFKKRNWKRNHKQLCLLTLIMLVATLNVVTHTIDPMNNAVEVLSCNNLDYFVASSTSQNNSRYNSWVNAIGTNNVPEYIQDFESFGNNQDIDGVNIGPLGLTLTNLDGGTLRTDSNIEGSPPIGNRGVRLPADAVDNGDKLRIEFDEDVDYVGFYHIDLTNPNHSSEVLVRFDDGSTCIFDIDHQPQNCQCEEFVGIVAKNGRKINRVDILPEAGSGWGIDNIMFGSVDMDCELVAINESNEDCNDNGTSSDASDDYITFNLNPTGENLASTYSVSVNNGATVSLANGNPATNISYGSPKSFRLQNGSANGINYIITVRDANDVNCTITTSLQQNSCSDACILTSANLSVESCDNNGTIPHLGDDYITFSLSPTGTNLGATYSVSANNGATVSLMNGNPATNVPFGTTTTFRMQNGSANGIEYTITVRSDASPDCFISFPVKQQPCSYLCDLSVQTFAPIYNDNNTPNILTDDTFTFQIIVQGSGPSGWEGGGQTGDFGVPTLFGPYPVDGAGALFELKYAGTETNCSVSVGVNLNSCIYTGACTCCVSED